MKYTAQITLTQIEPQAVKGENLDTEMKFLLEGCEPDGWEVTAVTLSRDSESKSKP